MKSSPDRTQKQERGGERDVFHKAGHTLALVGTGVVVGVVVLAPFPLASVEWGWIAWWGVLLAISTPLLDYSHLMKTQVRFLGIVMGASTVLAIFLLMQATGFLGLLPEHLLFTETRALIGQPVAGYASAVPAQSLLVAGGFALALLTFCACFVAGSNPKLARLILFSVAIAGTANGLLGLYLNYQDPTQLLWRKLDIPKGQPSGTFTNRNHAATLFASCAAIFFSVAVQRFLAVSPRGRMSLKSRLMIMMLNNPPQIGAALVLFITALGLTFATGSRGGLLALLCGLFTAYALLVVRSFGARLGALLAGGGAMLGVAFLSQVGLGSIGERFAQVRLSEDGRSEVYKAVLRMIRDNPWFGTGAGTFEMVFPRYRPDTISPSGIWDYAHSSPLQVIAELGIPAGILALGILVGIIGLCIWGSLNRRRDQVIPVIGASVGVAGLVHSFVDFSLQIPGFMIVYAAVLGVAAAQSFPTRRAGDRSQAVSSAPSVERR